MKKFINLVQNDVNGTEDLPKRKPRPNLTNGEQEAPKNFPREKIQKQQILTKVEQW